MTSYSYQQISVIIVEFESADQRQNTRTVTKVEEHVGLLMCFLAIGCINLGKYILKQI